MTEDRDFSESKYYVNRELSWFSFLERVLAQGDNPENTAEERAMFLGIVSRSLDEFFAIRLSTLIRQKKNTPDLKDICGLTAEEELKHILRRVNGFYKESDKCAESYVNYIKKQGISFGAKPADVKACTKRPIQNRIIPFNSAKIKSESVNIIFKSRNNPEDYYLLPDISGEERLLLSCDSESGETDVVLLEDLLKSREGILPDYIDCSKACVFKAVRDREEICEGDPSPERVRDWLSKLDSADFVCCVMKDSGDKECRDFLIRELNLGEEYVFTDKFVDMGFFGLLFAHGHDAEKSHTDSGSNPADRDGNRNVFTQSNPFEYLASRDYLCCHPYESFDNVTEFLRAAVKDHDVVSVRQTLYRTGPDSEVVNLLCEAAQAGKDVNVLMELRARYDEERNLENTEKLRKAGVKVLFGRAGIKAHFKVLTVERKEQGGIRRYAHVSTGNYNGYTAKTYTDLGLFTSAPGICDDLFNLFEYAAGNGEFPDLYSTAASPFGLKEEFIRLIEREQNFAEAGKPAGITAKVNSLCDADIIDALYRAASAGVKVKLIVRGICCLKTDTPGLNGNLTVCSVVGKQLEHSRIFRFLNAGNTEFYCSSADWMPRNFEGRIEVLFPIRDRECADKADLILNKLCEGSTDTMRLTDEGTYESTENSGRSVQKELTELIGGMA